MLTRPVKHFHLEPPSCMSSGAACTGASKPSRSCGQRPAASGQRPAASECIAVLVLHPSPNALSPLPPFHTVGIAQRSRLTDDRAFSIDWVTENAHEHQEPAELVFHARLMTCPER
jgi:hypothetical protein